jgi:hypothetical protein
MLQSVDICVKSVVVVVVVVIVIVIVIVVIVGSCRYVDLLVMAHVYKSMGIHA